MRERKVPDNDLDMAWMTVDPDYGELSEELQNILDRASKGTTEQKFDWQRLELFKSGFRLGNLVGAELQRVEENLSIAFECFSLGLMEAGLSFYNDSAIACEVSNSKKGFRSKMLNTINQNINKKEETAKRRGAFGGKQEDD